MDKMPCLSVVVPVFNSAATLSELCMRLKRVLEQTASEFELILVDDSSQDESWETIQQLAQENAWIRGIRLMRNYGQHNALLCGIRAAEHEIIITMDDDLQHPPEEIPKLLDKLAEGYDVVYGTPRQRQHGLWRNIASQVTRLALQGAVGADIASKVSPFRAFRTQVRDAFAYYQSPFVSIDVLLSWGTACFFAMPVRYDPRPVGGSTFTFRKLATHALDMITGFSTLPLQLASFIGFAFTLFGLGVLVFVVGSYLSHGGSVPGFPFLASMVALFSGVQLFALGIIGEYLARMHFRTMDRPPYVICSTSELDRSTGELRSHRR